MALLTEYDVVNMQFKEPDSIDTGYNQDEVDDFLDAVAETIAQLTAAKNELEEKLKAAQTRITELENELNNKAPEAVNTPADRAGTTAALADGVQGAAAVTPEATSATEMLALAQRLHDEHIANGRAEGERLVAEAEAEKVRIVTEAEDIHNRTLTKLEEERSVLERKISELREFERDYRTRLKSYLESLLNNVQNSDNQI